MSLILTHGTFQSYMAGCLEDCCFDAAKKVHQTRNAMTNQHQGHAGLKKTLHPVDFSRLTHGIRSTYVKGCRCLPCKASDRAYRVKRREIG